MSTTIWIIKDKQKITHLWKRWCKPHNFLLAFTDEFWKTWNIWILKKWKIVGDIILLMCTKNRNYMRYSSWDNPENQNFEKLKKKNIWRCHHFATTCATKNTIKWCMCMLTQIWSATGIIFCHFRPFFAFLPHYWP